MAQTNAEPKQTITRQTIYDERALFHISGAEITECVFDRGESPLKESSNLTIDTTLFRWKYPLWYCKHVKMTNSVLFEMARAGIWYTDDITIEDTVIEAPKNLRRGKGITLKNVNFPNAAETLWNCDGVRMENVTAKGDYFAFNTNNIEADHFTLVGNYSFDGSKNIVMRNSRLLSKDAFWNTENVTVYDSFISGEYLGWNAHNLRLVNCTIESLQGLCYVDRLVMENCRLINTTLAFEYSDVKADIRGKIDSVLNPGSGTIRADHIDRLIIQPDYIDPSKTEILCEAVDERPETIDWKLED